MNSHHALVSLPSPFDSGQVETVTAEWHLRLSFDYITCTCTHANMNKKYWKGKGKEERERESSLLPEGIDNSESGLNDESG